MSSAIGLLDKLEFEDIDLCDFNFENMLFCFGSLFNLSGND